MVELKFLNVFRRLIALLVVFASLLATSLPAIACEAAARHGECCPTNVPSPCSHADMAIGLRPTVAFCCDANPISATGVAAASSGINAERAQSSGSPEPLASSSLAVFSQRGDSAHSILSSASRALRNDASLTYLLTARLRL